MKKLSILCLAFLALLTMSCTRTKVVNNVKSSTVSVYSSDWYWENTSWRVDIDYDAISANVDDHGAVLVYMDYCGTWRQIPTTIPYQDSYGDFHFYSLEVSSYYAGVSIFWTENDLYQVDRPGGCDFKIVVIPGAVYGSRPDVNYEDYNAVKTAFQLND